MRCLTLAAVATLVLVAGACAPKTAPVPVVTTPRFPDFMRPVVPQALEGSPAAVGHDRAWYFLQAGDLRHAEQELAIVLKAVPTFFPAEAAAGYLELARKDAREALTRFDRALGVSADYVPALVGRGQALLAESRDSEALIAFEAALAADPSLSDLQRQVEVLRFRGVERSLSAARQAARAGRSGEAVQAYEEAIRSSPDSAFLYRELAGVERQRGEPDRALTHLRKTVELEPGDTASIAQIGEILEERGDVEGALRAYDNVLAVEANPAVEAKRNGLRARLDREKLPEEYRAIDVASQITRGDLAALFGVRLGSVLQTLKRGDAALLTDVRLHWAAAWIQDVASAGVIEPFANHTFQPATPVRRADLALAVQHLLSRAAPSAQVTAWQGAGAAFSDVSPGHLAYPAAAFAVASGVLATNPDGSFQPSRLVTGLEAVAVTERLAAILGAGPQVSQSR